MAGITSRELPPDSETEKVWNEKTNKMILLDLYYHVHTERSFNSGVETTGQTTGLSDNEREVWQTKMLEHLTQGDYAIDLKKATRLYYDFTIPRHLTYEDVKREENSKSALFGQQLAINDDSIWSRLASVLFAQQYVTKFALLLMFSVYDIFKEKMERRKTDGEKIQYEVRKDKELAEYFQEKASQNRLFAELQLNGAVDAKWEAVMFRSGKLGCFAQPPTDTAYDEQRLYYEMVSWQAAARTLRVRACNHLLGKDLSIIDAVLEDSERAAVEAAERENADADIYDTLLGATHPANRVAIEAAGTYGVLLTNPAHDLHRGVVSKQKRWRHISLALQVAQVEQLRVVQQHVGEWWEANRDASLLRRVAHRLKQNTKDAGKALLQNAFSKRTRALFNDQAVEHEEAKIDHSFWHMRTQALLEDVSQPAIVNSTDVKFSAASRISRDSVLTRSDPHRARLRESSPSPPRSLALPTNATTRSTYPTSCASLFRVACSSALRKRVWTGDVESTTAGGRANTSTARHTTKPGKTSNGRAVTV